ncbi:MAG TPA: hypothetical protein VGM54_08045 [Chthoniobacter sp.]|jgi:hypothetical protein
MTCDDSNKKARDARAVVLAWVSKLQSGEYSGCRNDELARRFCSLLPSDVDLELRATYNPSALVHEARWYHRGSEVAEFPKPFCAEDSGDAQILACAAMIALPD